MFPNGIVRVKAETTKYDTIQKSGKKTIILK